MSKTATMSKWQPIETAPKDESDVLLYFSEQMRSWDTSDVTLPPRICVGWKDHISGEWQTIEGNPIEGRATHWMPLPAPPSKDSQS